MYDTPQAGVGMDDRFGAGGDGQMILARGRTEDQGIARCRLPACWRETQVCCEPGHGFAISAAYSIAVRQARGFSQRHGQNPHAIEAMPGIASMEPEWCADQRQRRGCEFRPRHEEGVG